MAQEKLPDFVQSKKSTRINCPTARPISRRHPTYCHRPPRRLTPLAVIPPHRRRSHRPKIAQANITTSFDTSRTIPPLSPRITLARVPCQLSHCHLYPCANFSPPRLRQRRASAKLTSATSLLGTSHRPTSRTPPSPPPDLAARAIAASTMNIFCINADRALARLKSRPAAAILIFSAKHDRLAWRPFLFLRIFDRFFDVLTPIFGSDRVFYDIFTVFVLFFT